MRLPVSRPSLRAIAAFGLLGAPLAWTVQHVVGFALTLATCGLAMPGGAEVGPTTGTRSPSVLDAWTIVATTAGVVVVLLAGVAAIVAWRGTRGTGPDASPPEGRIHFMATVGLVITPLFLFIILMSGLTATALPPCVQA